MTSAFIHGFLLALALILPVGPQNSYVLSQGAVFAQYRFVIPIVLVAGLSDTALISVAVAGMGLVVAAIHWLRLALLVLGFFFLIWVGAQSWRQPGDLAANTDHGRWPLGRRVGYAVSVSLVNPHAVLDTVVVIGGGAALYTGDANKIAYAVAAVFVSWGWFFFLSLLGRVLAKLHHQALFLLNRASALLMWAIAVQYLFEVVRLR